MSSYKRSNKLVQLRGQGGKFRKANLADFGIQACKRPRICNQCQHEWSPIVDSGHCPQCAAQDSRETPKTEEEVAKLERLREIRKEFPGTHFREECQLEDWLKSRGLI